MYSPLVFVLCLQSYCLVLAAGLQEVMKECHHCCFIATSCQSSSLPNGSRSNLEISLFIDVINYALGRRIICPVFLIRSNNVRHSCLNVVFEDCLHISEGSDALRYKLVYPLDDPLDEQNVLYLLGHMGCVFFVNSGKLM